MMLTDHLGFAQLRPLLDELPQLQRLIFVGEEPLPCDVGALVPVAYREPGATEPEGELPISTISDMAAILATSGTTGPSKGCMISNRTGRTAVATGASSGWGMRFSRVLAQAGATVFALARRAALLKTLVAKQPGIEPVAMRRGGPRPVRPRDRAHGPGGCAGEQRRYRRRPTVENETVDVLARVLDVNVVAAFEPCRLVAASAPAPVCRSSMSRRSRAWLPAIRWVARPPLCLQGRADCAHSGAGRAVEHVHHRLGPRRRRRLDCPVIG